MGDSLGFDDIISIAIPFEQSFTQSITHGDQRQFNVAAGQIETLDSPLIVAALQASLFLFHDGLGLHF
jgi:hypothetical protein